MTFFAGLDWGCYEHALCVVDADGALIERITCTHDAEGLASLIKRLRRIASPEQLPIAIERPTGLIVDTLVEAGHPIVPIHPNVLKASRPRYGSAGAKSDPGDAFVLADVLRTDGRRLRTLRPASDTARALRALVRSRDDLVEHRVALCNQLRAHLEAFWPGAATLFAALHSPISLAFLEQYPTPARARALGSKRMAGFLKRQSYSGCRSAEELVQRLKDAPVGHADAIETEARGELVQDLVRIIATLTARTRLIEKRTEKLLDTMTVGKIMRSFPRAGRLNAAQIVAELGEDLARFGTEAGLACEAGVAPVTRASGRSRAVVFRFACNKRLRRALTGWADNSRHASPWAAGVYRRARERGMSHPHAVRVLARAWLRVLWRCYEAGTPYDETRHGGAIALEAG